MTTQIGPAGASLSERVAEEIRAMMARRRVSGRELARRLNVSASWVHYRLTGAQPIDLDDLNLIAQELGVRAGDLLPHSEGGTPVTRKAPTTRPGDHRPPNRPADRAAPPVRTARIYPPIAA